MIKDGVGKARRTGARIIGRGMAHAAICSDAVMIWIIRHGEGPTANISHIMARNTIAADTLVSECRLIKRRDNVALITILARWNMVVCFCRDWAIRRGEIAVMTTFAALCNVNVDIRIIF